MMKTEQDRTRFKKLVEEVAAKMTYAFHEPDGSFIKTSVMYPDGSYVVVKIDEDKERYMISDMGLGYQEAEFMGAGPQYVRIAHDIAEEIGVKFDHRSFFEMIVRKEQLPSAIATIANCSQEAVQQTAFKLAEKRSSDRKERIHNKLKAVFGPRHVATEVEFLGASSTKWHVSNLVDLDGRKAIFEPVSAHHNSVAAVVTKFLDISLLDSPPARVAMVRNKRAMNTQLTVVGSTASVIEDDAPDDLVRRSISRAA